MLKRGRPDSRPAGDVAAPADNTDGRLRMSFIPCGVAEAKQCWDTRVESPAVEVLIPGEDTGTPPGLGDVEVGEVDDAGPVDGKG